jgi:secondary thiamine-phosphate synthase enzyme
MDLRQRFQPSALLATHRWSVPLAAEFGHADITPELQELVSDSGMQTGVLLVQLLGSTGAITTIEYESGALSDLRRALEKLAPADADYAHNARWGDGNGFSHVRSALLKTSLSLPVVDGELAVGTWQQVVAINLDNRDRERELVAVLVGSA